MMAVVVRSSAARTNCDYTVNIDDGGGGGNDDDYYILQLSLFENLTNSGVDLPVNCGF